MTTLKYFGGAKQDLQSEAKKVTIFQKHVNKKQNVITCRWIVLVYFILFYKSMVKQDYKL